MDVVRPLSPFLRLCLTFFAMLFVTSFATIPIAKPGCPTRCGKVTIPYPFGINLEIKGCSFSEFHNIHCDTSFNPPQPYLLDSNNTRLEIIDVSQTGQMRIRYKLARKCYQPRQVVEESTMGNDVLLIDLRNLPLVVSDTANKFIGIGCKYLAMMVADYTQTQGYATTGCVAMCGMPELMLETNDTSCLGVGCCQSVIPNKGLKRVLLMERSIVGVGYTGNTNLSYCTAAFIAEVDKFNFRVADLIGSNAAFINRTTDNVSMVLDWYVGVNETCQQAQQNMFGSDYTCKENTQCTDVSGGTISGYRCSCQPGYEGNPYLSPGCTDINECEGPSNPCTHICENIIGNYTCSCPKGYSGNGRKDGGSPCIKTKSDTLKLGLGLAATLGSLLLAPIGWWFYIVIKKREAIKKKARNFKKNGGLLLQHRMSSDEHIVERTHFFTIDELEKATDHFNESRILGRGGQGIVYKGMLGEGRLIAVKKSKTLNEDQQADFINEVVIMSQIIHRNIVRLLGCCLESEVPLLVYEFVPNGTLFNHLHHLNEEFPITWRMRLQIASDLAGALAYLHSFSYVPILHRDIKSSNILLDDKYRAKLSDFGLSKSVAPDQTHVTTRVMGTFGYLDPEYFQTHQYTEKSDVYSFGVVLVELITGQRAIRAISDQDRSLVSWFLSHMENSQFLDIVDPQLVKESSKEEIYTIADLATQCLYPKGTRRPTMKEAQLVLETKESPQTNEVETSSQFEQVLAAGTTNTSYHENVAPSSTSSMHTRCCQSAELSLLFNPR